MKLNRLASLDDLNGRCYLGASIQHRVVIAYLHTIFLAFLLEVGSIESDVTNYLNWLAFE